MVRKLPLVLLLAAAALVATGDASYAPTQALAADPQKTGYPNSMASTGDSITRATNSAFIGDAPEHSWSTGSNAAIQSHYLRILQQNGAIAGKNFNDAVSGARMTHLNGQVQAAVGQGVEYVTILMGANDVCTSSEATMTAVATFRSQFGQAMATLSSGLPDARILVVSIPDIHRLWFILKDNPTARSFWSFFGICQSMLANPASTAQEDIDRRNRVRQRNIDFNTVLAEVCAQYIHCRFDNNAGFNAQFEPVHVSTMDYFHPSVAGQTLGASVAWAVGFDFSDAIAPVSSLAMTPVSGGASVSMTATDNVGVAGIEYKINLGSYQRYSGPVTAIIGDIITYRAVDVNGNIEASRSCRIVPWPVPAGDTDCDGFSTADEGSIGTDALVACDNGLGPPDWPVDFDNSKTVNIVDVLAMKPVFGTPSPRHDLDASGGNINIADVLRMKPFFGKACSP